MAQQQRMIRIRQARTNNLRALDLDVPRGRLVVFAGVSGSGKSSLVFDTIAAEAGRQLTETFPPFTRNRLPKWAKPDVARIDGLSPVVVIDQRRLGGNARSTVGTVTDAWTYLRLLFSRLSTPHVGESSRFSFNDPAGMCPACSGLGERVVTDVDRVLDLDRSLRGGAVRLPGFGDGGYWYSQYADIGEFDQDTPLRDWTPQQREALLYGGRRAARLGGKPAKAYEGIVERFERIYLHTTDDLSDRKRAVLARFTRSQTCPDCHGDRLNKEARSATVLDRTIAEMSRMEITELAALVTRIREPRALPVVTALHERLTAMDTIGLGYLNLGRGTATLSGGESQRVKTVKHLGSSLIEMLYVFDEPTAGLHPADVDAMTTLLVRLRDAGNTVLVVEHDPAVMAAADQVVEIGPGAGEHGGKLVFQGTFAELTRAGTPTGKALAQPLQDTRPPRKRNGTITVSGATRNNLRNLSVDLPESVLTVLTGVAGSGKSSLAAELVARHDAVVIDQRPVSTNGRSTPITYTGIAAAIRKLFARRNGVPAALFSPNSAGGCPACQGRGVIMTDLAFMAGQETICEVCGGRRFKPEVLRHHVDGLSIADVDEITIAEAVHRLPDPAIVRALEHLDTIGLGYLRLGQRMTTLSGGEAQRVKIAKELRDAAGPTLYVLDEPTTGLHLHDVAILLHALDRLVDDGHTVVVIEHHLAVIRHADWLVDLGPGPGRHGGCILYAGPVADIPDTATGRALRSAAG
ncbi:ATP-binding cassette domain-containing protein [Actinoplanes aureus]|uniref:UvrABC system protein A n=1 Tax=Actinoplanes aureus TaxID=2792083 RepID=A0A931FWJ1_9ACTN|nr:excinuclease ABC subunit UvrA [Actinoplanes aureus]MBG0562498.1 excinuclease ABC subunit UvrA [Actinoplanes aureus]